MAGRVPRRAPSAELVPRRSATRSVRRFFCCTPRSRTVCGPSYPRCAPLRSGCTALCPPAPRPTAPRPSRTRPFATRPTTPAAVRLVRLRPSPLGLNALRCLGLRWGALGRAPVHVVSLRCLALRRGCSASGPSTSGPSRLCGPSEYDPSQCERGPVKGCRRNRTHVHRFPSPLSRPLGHTGASCPRILGPASRAGLRRLPRQPCDAAHTPSRLLASRAGLAGACAARQQGRVGRFGVAPYPTRHGDTQSLLTPTGLQVAWRSLRPRRGGGVGRTPACDPSARPRLGRLVCDSADCGCDPSHIPSHLARGMGMSSFCSPDR